MLCFGCRSPEGCRDVIFRRFYFNLPMNPQNETKKLWLFCDLKRCGRCTKNMFLFICCLQFFISWRGRGCNIFVPVLGGNGTKIAPTGDIFGQPPGQMRWIRGKLADHVGDHVVSSPEGAVLVTSPGTKSLYSRPPQSLNPSKQSEIRGMIT